ncbi:homoserine O-acetyltransferase/O-succinyltransferase family protein [Shigella flexneri]
MNRATRPQSILNNFYCNFEDIQDQNFDGLIVTGAPLGLVEFNDVAYWPYIKQVLEWSNNYVTSTLFVCWAVQAVLNILYGIPKQTRTDNSLAFTTIIFSILMRF